MKIGVYGKSLSHLPLSGIGYYVLHLLEALQRIDTRNEYTVLPRASERTSFGYSYFGFPRAFEKTACDLAFVPRETVPPFLKKPTIITVFDLFFLKCARELRKGVPLSTLLHYQMAARWHCKRADAILAISETTRDDLIHLCEVSPEKIALTPLGVDLSTFYPRSNDSLLPVLTKYQIAHPYFINVSSVWCARKNLIRLIQAFALFHKKHRTNHQLVITGSPGDAYPEMRALIQKEKLEDKIKLLHYVHREELPFLLSGAEAFVFPSFHEWYGLPILEAMACGCPVITTQAPKQSKEQRNVGLFIDPTSPESISSAMETVIAEPNRAKELKIKGVEAASHFSWKRTAAATLATFERFE